MSNTSNIAKVLAQGIDIKNKTAAKVTGDKVGIEAYTAWATAVNAARLPFYNYWQIKNKNPKLVAIGKDALDIEPAKDKAMDALQAILDAVGNVHGHPLRRSKELLDELCVEASKKKDELAGEALLVDSRIKNYEKQLDQGGNDEFIADIEEKLAAAEEELKELKKLPGSCKPADGQCSASVFIKRIERELGLTVAEQYAKSAEQVQAEEEAYAAQKKAERANRQREKRAAKKAAATANA